MSDIEAAEMKLNLEKLLAFVLLAGCDTEVVKDTGKKQAPGGALQRLVLLVATRENLFLNIFLCHTLFFCVVRPSFCPHPDLGNCLINFSYDLTGRFPGQYPGNCFLLFGEFFKIFCMLMNGIF
jgi:hypothetical protein